MKRFGYFLLMLMSFLLVSCNKKLDLNLVIEDLSDIFIENDTFNSVENNLSLKYEYKNKDITIDWISSNEDVVDKYGNVTRIKEDVNVELVLKVSYKGKEAYKKFDILVKGLPDLIKFEDLNDFPILSDISSGIFEGDNIRIKYNNVLSSYNDNFDYSIDNQGIILIGYNNNSYIEFELDSLDYLKFDYRKAFFSNISRKYKVIIKGNNYFEEFLIEPFGSTFGEDDTVYSFEVFDLGIKEKVLVKIISFENDGYSQITIDSISWK